MTTATKQLRSKTRGRQASRHQPALPGQVGALRKRFRLSQALLARLLDVSLRTVSGAESDVSPPAQLRRNLTQITRLCQALAEAVEPTFVGPWLDHPNEMLAGLKPVEAIERGQLDLVWQVIQGLRSGSAL
jgi:DNA-binding transcriptional regulator YiaG